MEEIELTNATAGGRSVKAVHVNRYPDSPWATRNVHVFMASWDAKQWLSVKMILWMIWRVQQYDKNTYDLVHPLVTRNELYFIPLPNPDGYEHTITKQNRFWMKNMREVIKGDFRCVGVNLEANVAGDGKDKFDDECGQFFSGFELQAEAETEAFLNFTKDLLINQTKPINLYQIQEMMTSVLVPPFSKAPTSEKLPVFGPNLLKFYRDKMTEMVDSFNVTSPGQLPYGPQFGFLSLHPPPAEHMMDDLIAAGFHNCFLVGIPLTWEDMISPTGANGTTLTESFGFELLRSAALLAVKDTALESATPILSVVLTVLPCVLVVVVMKLVFEMQDDTVRIQGERAAKAEVTPELSRAMGAARKFSTKVISGNEVRRRTMGIVVDE